MTLRCEDRGPDLLARALGQLDAGAAAECDRHLRECPSCSADAERLAEAVAQAAAQGARARGAAPSPALRARILAAVRDEAAERRSDAAVAASAACPAVREELVALAAGSLEDEQRVRVETHVAGCAPCADELAGAGRLVAAARAAARAEAPSELRARILAALPDERFGDTPPPPPRLHVLQTYRARRARRIPFLVPLVAAAGVLAALVLTAPAVELGVQGESAAVFFPVGESAGSVPLDREHGEVSLDPGEGVGAGERAVEVRLRTGGRRAAGPTSGPGVGELRLTLQPASKLVRVGDEDFELVSGRVSVHAGRLERRFTLRHGPAWATIVGTRFDAAVEAGRLLVSVHEGDVEVGSEGGGSAQVGPGEDALADGSRVVTRTADAVPAASWFLAPRATVAVRTPVLLPGEALVLDAELAAGRASPVTIPAPDDSDPRYLVRLKGPDERTHEVKVQRSMVERDAPGDPGPAGGRTVRLEDGRPYRLRIRIDALDLQPGRWEASLRCQSYGRDGGAEWHGSVESAPAAFEVRPPVTPDQEDR